MAQVVRFCEAVDGAKLAYAVLGRGPVVIYVCGWPEHLEMEWQQPFARTFLERMSRGCTLVRYDMRGSGLSDRDATDISFPKLLADLETVANQLGASRFQLLSLGMLGGPLAVAYAARHPERVQNLFIYGGYLRGADLMSRDRRAHLIGYVSEFGFPHFDFVDGSDVDLESQLGVRTLERAGAAPKVQASVLRAFFEADLVEVAPRVAVRTLVAHGDQDALVPLECGRQLAAAIPGSQFATVPARSTAPWAVQQRLLPLLTGFLGTNGAGDAHTRYGQLTARERCILELLADGLSNREIATQLTISEKTVKTHVSNLLAKLGARNRADAVATAIRAGVLEP